MGNRSFLFCSVSAALLLWSGNVGAQCVMNQDCATLGYTKTAAECSGTGIKCPFGDKWSCVAKPARAACAIGWIYYADGTCVTPAAHNSCKAAALGVVVHVNPDGIGGQVMVARDLGQMYWSTEIVDIAGLPNYTTEESASRDFNSCSNTDKILADRQTSYPAAHAARNYAPTTETNGKWCLPAAGIMTNIFNNQSAVQAGIARLGGTAYPNCCTWSSSEYSHYTTYGSYLNISYGLSRYNKHNTNLYVRPVMEF